MNRNIVPVGSRRQEHTAPRWPCKLCQDNRPHWPCSLRCVGIVTEDGTIRMYPRLPVKDHPCPSCGAPIGGTHHLSCPLEICPVPGCRMMIGGGCDHHFDFVSNVTWPHSCPLCSGNGYLLHNEGGRKTCATCHGTGWVRTERRI